MEVTDLVRVGGMQRREIQSSNDVSIGIKGFSFLDSIYLNVICQLTLSLYSSRPRLIRRLFIISHVVGCGTVIGWDQQQCYYVNRMGTAGERMKDRNRVEVE